MGEGITMPDRRLIGLVIAILVMAASCASDDTNSDDTASGDATTETSDQTDADPGAGTESETDTGQAVDGGSASEGDPGTGSATSEDAPTTETTSPEAPGVASAQLPSGWEGHTSDIYADDGTWICRPGAADDWCSRNLDATLVRADGTTEIEPFEAAVDPGVDCFYVYPTVSRDEGPNSDLDPGIAEEINTVINQAARLSAHCRVFAPVYRQITLSVLSGTVASDEDDRQRAYDDVLDAFQHYLANDNGGRPIVLAGHSQGTGLLARLISEEIDPEPLLADRIVSALMLGGRVGPDEWTSLPSCTSVDDTGCTVAFASFRDTAPPPENSLFGKSTDGPADCVNPVDPAGGAHVARPYFTTDVEGLGLSSAAPFDDPELAAEITTPFVAYPDMIEIECVEADGFGFLQVTVITDDGPRADDIRGDLTPQWGLHLIDANLAMGDLVELVGRQVAAWEAA